ncbi:FMN-binding protein [Phycicoccus sp. CSK15P-2]|uniref:FMN-binding protein n=1 Tax=Phycicoccus sp. CSK15P-2 TaxID=2807627 RepID=UPI0019510046|nr:FMN-binding protein [Phycicoccus sp. CSK15P-2]MBM6404701.1 FMN-binding protein [Phycicoccus sp. CSK15P-2]
MRRITTWMLSTVSALVLLFSYHTSTGSGVGSSAVAVADPTVNGSTEDGPGSSTGSATPTPEPTTPDPTSGAEGTYTGDAVQTRYGPVQVEITVSGGKITESVVTQVPWNDHHDQQINSYAVPILNEEAVRTQSADIDMVSGATFTSDGYVRSLQSAIDQANL